MQNDNNILSEFYQTIDLPMNDVFSVYHYTSISALKCIIENNSLWLSERDSMNDVFDRSYIEQKMSDNFPDDFKTNGLVNRISSQYIFSTSKTKDSFFHYKCYGNYCIEFKTEELNHFIKECIKSFGPHEGFAHPFTSSEVIYIEYLKAFLHTHRYYCVNINQTTLKIRS